MNIQDALTLAKEGNFLSNQYFTDDQSMHYYEENYYYEDGAVLNDKTLNEIENSNWGSHNWYIKFPTEKVDTEILKTMHEDWKHKMLHDKSYEDCIQHDIIKDVTFNDLPPSKYDYKYFTIIFNDGSTKEFYYGINNPIPTKEEIVGKSLYELREICRKMWYEGISNIRELLSKE